MFLRRCERTKSGKNHVYWALVESYRTTDGSRQRVVAYLTVSCSPVLVHVAGETIVIEGKSYRMKDRIDP